MTKLLGTDELMDMAYPAEDMDKEVRVYRDGNDEDVILYIEIDGEDYWNDLYDVEMDDSDAREARRYYRG